MSLIIRHDDESLEMDVPAGGEETAMACMHIARRCLPEQRRVIAALVPAGGESVGKLSLYSERRVPAGSLRRATAVLKALLAEDGIDSSIEQVDGLKPQILEARRIRKASPQ